VDSLELGDVVGAQRGAQPDRERPVVLAAYLFGA
jgi:hypothetical protein